MATFQQPTQGTVQNYGEEERRRIQEEQRKAEIERKRQACIARGGTFDENTLTCSLPDFEKIPVQQNQPNEPPQSPNSETSQNKNITFNKDGTVTITQPGGQPQNFTRDEYRNIMDLQKFGGSAPNEAQAEAAKSSAQIAQDQRQAQIQQLAQEIGNIPGLTPAQQEALFQNITGKQQFKEGLPGALREGTTSAVTRGLSYAAAGFAAGSIVPGLGNISGAVAGGVAGIVSGYWTALRKAKKSEAKEDVTNAMSEFTQLRRGMTQVATLASSGYINPEEAVELFNAQYSRMRQIEAQIKYLQDTNLKDYLSDGSDDLVEIQTYLSQVVPAYRIRLQTSLTNPTTKIPYSDVFAQDQADLAVLD